MFVGETGVDRVVQRAVELMREDPNQDPRARGGLDLPTVQKYINLWFSLSLDLFGGEVSSNAADFFAAGLKGRYREAQHADHRALVGTYRMEAEEVPLRNAMNEILRDNYVEDCQRAVDRWNRTIEKSGVTSFRLALPHRRFHRHIGRYATGAYRPDGEPVAATEWEQRKGEWLPSAGDREWVRSLMHRVHERGKIAAWIAPPAKGINGNPFDFEYVRRS